MCAGIGTQRVGGNSSRRAGSQEGSALAAAQEQAFRLNPGLQVLPSLSTKLLKAALVCVQNMQSSLVCTSGHDRCPAARDEMRCTI